MIAWPWYNINEPVLSFVKVFFNNPKRFVFKELDRVRDTYTVSYRYSVEDKILNITFNFEKKYPRVPYYLCQKLVVEEFDLTEDEQNYLIDNIESYFQTRTKKINKIKDNRKRQYYTNLYKA